LTEGNRNQKKSNSEAKTLPVPFALDEITENVSISTIRQEKSSKSEIINQAFKFHSQGDIPEATKYYQQLIQQGCNDHRVFSNYGVILKNLGKLQESEISLRKAIKLKPDFADSHSNLGNILKDLGNLNEAEKFYRKAIQLNPEFDNAYYNLGNILKDLGNLNEAEKFYRKAIQLNPKIDNAHYNLGNVLKDLGNLNQAKNFYLKAIQLNPKFDKAYYNLGNILRDLGNLNEAENFYRKTIQLNPDFADAHSNLGNILAELGKLQEAELSTRKAIELKPNFAEANFNLSLLLLKLKIFKEGWDKYEWRWKCNNINSKLLLKTNKPKWTKENRGRVLLWVDQGLGLGDQILFCSLISDFIYKVDKIILKVDKRLIPLLKRSFKNNIEFISMEESANEKEYDYHLPIGSLAKYLRKTLDSFDSLNKFSLLINKEKAKEYKKRLLNCKHKKLIGISWTSKSKKFPSSLMTLKKMISGIYSPGIRFINLQYGDVKEEIKNVIKNLGVEVLEIEELDYFNDIDDLAALISACDEIVTIDNITATLSGALGVNTKVIIPKNSYWPYGVKDKQSYWFRSIKIFRQIKKNDWSTPLNEIRKEIIK
tara:strand:- start:8058 stop:9848 length:1791 start_codon:yes stop_codon:yes gene_type:complete